MKVIGSLSLRQRSRSISAIGYGHYLALWVPAPEHQEQLPGPLGYVLVPLAPLGGIMVRTGAPWKDLPERYPPYQTCHRRFQRRIEEGVLGSLLEALAEDQRST